VEKDQIDLDDHILTDEKIKFDDVGDENEESVEKSQENVDDDDDDDDSNLEEYHRLKSQIINLKNKNYL
jgi:hypothetical protein